MAEQALDVQTDSCKSERKCRGCGNAPAGKGRCGHCGFCSTACQSKFYRKHAPYRKPRECRNCGQVFIAKNAAARFCGMACKERSRYLKHQEKRAALSRKRREENADHVRSLDRASYYRMKDERPEDWKRFCERSASASKAWRERDPEYARSKDREWRRNTAAKAALSAILLPVHKSPEVNQ